MLTRSQRAVLCAILPFFAGVSAAHSQNKTPALSAQQSLRAASPDDNQLSQIGAATAQFGAIEIDESRAKNWRDLIDSKELKKQVANMPGALSYREGALGFYRVGFEATGDRQNGRVRVSVTIVGQNGDRTILATSQSEQRWQNGVFIYEEPTRRSPQIGESRENFGNNSPLQLPAPSDFRPASFDSAFARAMYREFCAPSREEKTGHADGKKNREDNDKRDDKPEPKRDDKREEKPEPKRAPEPKPEPRREEPKRDERPQRDEPKRDEPKRDERPEWERKTKPRQEESPQPTPQPAPPAIETPRAPQPQPEVEPKRAPNPNPQNPSRAPQQPEAPRPNSPAATIPPRVSAPDLNPFSRDNTTAPNPNPPSSGTVPIGPNPNPPNRGGVHQESRPSRDRDPYWRGTYGGYPYPGYPYPDPYSYPYPYPQNYPYPPTYPYPDSYPYPRTYPYPPALGSTQEGARQAFDYALIAARAEAHADFDRQLMGDPAPQTDY